MLETPLELTSTLYPTVYFGQTSAMLGVFLARLLANDHGVDDHKDVVIEPQLPEIWGCCLQKMIAMIIFNNLVLQFIGHCVTQASQFLEFVHAMVQ